MRFWHLFLLHHLCPVPSGQLVFGLSGLLGWPPRTRLSGHTNAEALEAEKQRFVEVAKLLLHRIAPREVYHEFRCLGGGGGGGGVVAGGVVGPRRCPDHADDGHAEVDAHDVDKEEAEEGQAGQVPSLRAKRWS